MKQGPAFFAVSSGSVARVACLVLVLFSSANSASAQGRSESAIPVVRQGKVIRVRLLNGTSVQGRVMYVHREPLSYQLDTAMTLVPAATIDSLWVQRRMTTTGALAGGIIGGVGLGGVMLVACNVAPDANCWSGFPGIAFGVGIVGGGLLGAGIGTMFTKWQPVPSRLALVVQPDQSIRIGLRSSF